MVILLKWFSIKRPFAIPIFFVYCVIILTSLILNCGSSDVSSISNSGTVPGMPSFTTASSTNSDNTYVISWTNMTEASEYILHEDNNEEFLNPTEYLVTSNTYNFSNKTDGIYYYRVKARSSAGSSKWSNSIYRYVGTPFTIPLAIGNKWIYDYLISLDDDHSSGAINLELTNIETINSEQWYKGSITGDSIQLSDISETISKTYYFRKTNDYVFAFSTEISNSLVLPFLMFAPKDRSENFKFKDKTFSDINELRRYLFLDKLDNLNLKFSPKLASQDNDTPISKLLKFPLIVGDSWLIRDNFDTGYIIKRYVESFENHTVNSQEIYCAKLKYNYYFNNYPALDSPDTSIIFYTWVSNYGIVDKYFKASVIQMSDSGIRTVPYEERYTLKNSTVQ